MNVDLKKAKNMLDSNQYTCVFVKNDSIYTSTQRGVKPLLELLDSGEFKGFSAADRVIGKAAAYLYVLLEVKSVYARIVSDQALEVLKRHGIDAFYGESVKAIINRTNTGLCPMETCVADKDTPEAALEAIKSKLIELSSKKI